jgi:acyl dehydratase
MRVFKGVDEVRAAEGTRLGESGWVTVEQQHIDQFAEATGDRQWIHVDSQKAARGPFGKTIAHGFLSLSLLPVLVSDVYRIEGVRMGINYGLNRVRFTAPVLVDSKVRAVVDLVGVKDAKDGAVQLTTRVVVELEGSERPALVAEWLTLQYA